MSGKTKPRGSLLLATYEMPRHLSLVLAALERQTVSPEECEILICDDGSGEETKAQIDAFKERTRFQVKHIWQEHQGFRKCRMLNEALRQSEGETFIFLDGDCVPHQDYLRDHLENQEPGRYLAGRRVELGESISASLTPEQVRAGFFDSPHPRLILSAFRGETENLQRSVRIPWAGLRKRLRMDRIDDLKGCNYSVSRRDMEAVNGFDEEYEGYGREDTDIELRLQNLGLKIKSMKGLAIQFHVWHPRREFTPANDARLEELKRSGRIKCSQGLKRS
jgi:GT2 family glycosyltransferase